MHFSNWEEGKRNQYINARCSCTERKFRRYYPDIHRYEIPLICRSQGDWGRVCECEKGVWVILYSYNPARFLLWLVASACHTRAIKSGLCAREIVDEHQFNYAAREHRWLSVGRPGPPASCSTQYGFALTSAICHLPRHRGLLGTSKRHTWPGLTGVSHTARENQDLPLSCIHSSSALFCQTQVFHLFCGCCPISKYLIFKYFHVIYRYWGPCLPLTGSHACVASRIDEVGSENLKSESSVLDSKSYNMSLSHTIIWASATTTCVWATIMWVLSIITSVWVISLKTLVWNTVPWVWVTGIWMHE